MNSTEIKDAKDLLKVLRNYPDLFEEIRRLILTEELINLPKKFKEFLEKNLNH